MPTLGQRKIGLTGGIATGKSTVSHYLETVHHLPVLDADIYAREAVQPGSPILQAISDRYGTSILTAEGQLNRAALGQIIFEQESERRWLEDQIHPYVRRAFHDQLTQLCHWPVVVLSIPLLFEAKLTAMVTEIWVVACHPEQQLQRLTQRNALDPEAAKARIQAQFPLADKCAQADHVLDNSRGVEQLYAQIDRLLRDPRV